MIKKRGCVVSDHAMLRYLERAYNINLEELRDRILTKEVIKKMHFIGFGQGKVPLAENLTAVVENKTIITVLLPLNNRKKLTKRNPRSMAKPNRRGR